MNRSAHNTTHGPPASEGNRRLRCHWQRQTAGLRPVVRVVTRLQQRSVLAPAGQRLLSAKPQAQPVSFPQLGAFFLVRRTESSG